MTTPYSIDNAMDALPHLVYHATVLKRPLTYGELGDLIGKHYRAVQRFIGYIRDEICLKDNRPMLNVLVVNGQTHMPGENFLVEGTAQLSAEEYKRRFEYELQRVYDYPHWNEVLQKYQLNPLSKPKASSEIP